MLRDRLTIPRQGSKTPSSSRRADRWARYLTLTAASSILFLTLLYFLVLTRGSERTLTFGLGFIFGSKWDPVANVFGLAPEIYGSMLTSAIALVIGVPVSIGVAVFLSELAPARLRAPVSFLVEMLAAVPSVVYGLWGLLVLAPFLQTDIYPTLGRYLSFLPLFQGRIYYTSFLTAGIVLALMIVPIVSAISRDVLLAVPQSQREAAYALGATRSEMVRMSVLSNARPGMVAAVFLGFGRAFGETMAVVMLVGNSQTISASLFSPGSTLASLIATQYADASTALEVSAVVEAGLVLLLVAMSTCLVGRLLIRRFLRSKQAALFQ